MASKKSKKKDQGMLSAIFWGAAGATANVAGEAAKEVMVGPKKSKRKSVKRTTGDGFWSIFTG